MNEIHYFPKKKEFSRDAKALRLFYSSLSHRTSKRFDQTDNEEIWKFQIETLAFKLDCDMKHWLKVISILGDDCNICPSGWSSHFIGTTRKCLFMTKSKIEISQLDTFCQSLNATVPYPKTNKEIQNYLDALERRNLTFPVAIRSFYGIVELHRNGFWKHFPTETSLNAMCEKASFVLKTRIRRQEISGNKLPELY